MELTDLEGEGWRIQYSPDGTMLAGCGSNKVIIWDKDYQVHSILKGHDEGVGSIAWSPDASLLVTCSQDKTARVWRVQVSASQPRGGYQPANGQQDGECLKKTKRFSQPVSSCVWAKDGQSFVLGTLDIQHSLCTYGVRDFDMIEWGKKHRVQDLCGSPDGHWLVAVDDQHTIYVYNAGTRELEYELELPAQPTSVSISEDSKHLLVNKRDGETQLIDLETREPVQKFLGNTGGDFLIRSSFGGANESFIASGSEDGYVLIWHKITGAAVERLNGHSLRCNAVAWKPDDPSMLASCGDDGKVKMYVHKISLPFMETRY